jgi:hypothetical protein
MKTELYLAPAQVACFANDNDAFIPEMWANEGLAILEENMVIANLVHRDFENEVRDYGDVVNTRRPGTFKIRRKKDGTTLTQQDAVATNVRVPLDQWFYTSFTIKDGEASKSFQDLVDIYLRPGMQTIARGVDRAVLGQCHGFLANKVGRLGNLTAANSKDYLLEARERMNINKAPVDGRNLVLAPASETALLKNEMFIKANERGDGGTALQNATLGRVLGFNTYMDQNVNSIAALGCDTVAGAVANAGGYAAGEAGALAVDGFTGARVTGEYAVVAGNDQPTSITAHVEAVADTTSITLSEALKYAVANDAVVTVYKSCAVKGAYAAGYSEAVVVDGWTALKAPQVGQLIAFGTGASRHVYTVIESWLSAAGEQSLILDRPLAAALADDAIAFPGPAGAMNMAFHRDAIALVTRPLAVPAGAMGVLSHVGVYNDIAMRVSMQYDIQEGGTVVNLDILAGVAVLDENLCVVLLG